MVPGLMQRIARGRQMHQGGGRQTCTGVDLHATVGTVPEVRCAQAWIARDIVDWCDGGARRSLGHGLVSAASMGRHDDHSYPSQAYGRMRLAGPGIGAPSQAHEGCGAPRQASRPSKLLPGLPVSPQQHLGRSPGLDPGSRDGAPRPNLWGPAASWSALVRSPSQRRRTCCHGGRQRTGRPH